MLVRKENGLITVTSGKLTTFRLMAVKTLELAGKQLSLDTSGLAGQKVLAVAGCHAEPADPAVSASCPVTVRAIWKNIRRGGRPGARHRLLLG